MEGNRLLKSIFLMLSLFIGNDSCYKKIFLIFILFVRKSVCWGWVGPQGVYVVITCVQIYCGVQWIRFNALFLKCKLQFLEVQSWTLGNAILHSWNASLNSSETHTWILCKANLNSLVTQAWILWKASFNSLVTHSWILWKANLNSLVTPPRIRRKADLNSLKRKI